MPVRVRRRSRFAVLLSTLLAMTAAVTVAPAVPAAAVTTPTSTVFINELHYDNASGDVGEFVEVAGPAGTDLTGWSLVLYNGSNGEQYNSEALSGTLTDQGGAYGTQSVLISGIQNGGPDGVALIDPTSTVVEFLSYEGTFTAVDGDASGMTSTDIGVSESSSTPIGASLARIGTGTTAGDFVFAVDFDDTPGAVNNGQTFGGSTGPADPVINELGVSDTSTDNEFVEIFGDPNTDYTTYSVLQIDSDASDAGEIDAVVAVGTADANGLWFTDVAANTFENGDTSFLLVENFSGADNDDLDTNDDGTFDVTPWDRIVDSVSIEDGGGTFYGTPLLDESFDDARLPTNGFAPGGLSRIPDGTDTDAAADWYRNDFSWDGTTNGSPEVGEALNTPGQPNAIVPPPAPMLSITEVMQNPDAVSDGSGEWFEVYNAGSSDIDLNGWTISDLGSDTHTIAGTVTVPAGGYAVLGNNADSATNGGVTVDYEYSAVFLSNSADELLLTDTNATEVDRIEWDGGPIWPDPTGASMTLGNLAADNNDGTNWCEATTPYGAGDLGTPGAANDACTVVPPTIRLIHEIQGNGSSVAITTPVIVEAIVTSLFTENDVLDGFFIQEEAAQADADDDTSEGIFVFCRGNCPATIAVGDLVQVSGTPTDFFGMSQLDMTAGSVTIVSSDNTLPTAAMVDLPAAGRTDAEATFESVEGMLVQFTDKLVISEYFELARYGQLVLTADARAEQFTDANAPSVGGYAAFLDDLESKRIILDDDNNDQNDATEDTLDNEVYPWPQPGLSSTNTFRGGDSITGLTGVLHWSWAGFGGTDAWRIRPVDGVDYTFTSENPRTAAPADVGGTLKVASFNVLNYFATVGGSTATCGPSALECRGAESEAERVRQLDKIVSALAAIDADVVGLIEIENDSGDQSVNQIIDALNAVVGAGTYDSIDTGSIGGDAIKVAFIYKPATVTAVGDFAILDSSVDPTFIDDKNRPVLIQTFEEEANGERVTVAINHFKSKGSDCDDLGDPDLLDGQARCPGTRTNAAIALAAYLGTDPTGSGSGNFLIMGDLNAYAMEDPITALEDAGYTDLIEQFIGPDAYGYLFDGQTGYLDHALANPTLLPFVTGTDIWHINADEAPLLDYNDTILDSGEQGFERKSNALPLYSDDPYRSSDHDPVIVGLALGGTTETLVLVTGRADRPGRGDQAVIDIAEALGFDVVLVDDDEADLRSAVQAENPSVVLLSSSVTLSKVGADLANLGVGLVTWEGYLHDDNLLATTSGEQTADNRVIVKDSTHPVAAGLSGTVFVTAPAAPQSFLVPAGEATDVAGPRAIPSRSVVAAWDTGDLLADGQPSAARAVAFFTDFQSPAFLTADGEAMFEAAILWAAGGSTTPVNQTPTVNAGADVTLRLPAAAVSLDATTGDDGLLGPLTFNWTQVSGPAATFGDANAEDTDVTLTMAGVYEFQLEVDDGELTAADTVVVTLLPEGTQVLFVAGSAAPPPGDRAVVERIEAAGATVTFIDDDDVAAGVDLVGIDAVFVSTSVVFSKVGDAFKTAPIPVVIWEGYLLDDMGLGRSGESGTTFTTIDIAAPSDPLAAGLTGSPVVYTQANKLTFAVVGAEAEVAATQPGAGNRAVVFSYAAGDMLFDGSAATGDRYGLFLDYFGAQRLSANGVAIVDAVIAAALS